MLFRAQVRQVANAAVTAALQQQNATVSTSKDTPIPAEISPSVVIYTDDVKEWIGGSPPAFRTTVLTTVEITATGDTKEVAESLMDTLCDAVETALFNGGSAFQKLFEAIDSVESRPDYRGISAKKHTFITVMEIKGHATETFEPTGLTPLGGINIYVDSVNVFDPLGEVEPPFNYPVAATPRAKGPDGRVEISASLEIPTE